jgi:enamine deaminase RidA (YjgF/YER057c/UK114 family)
LAQALEANGLSFSDVVKENVFATDLDAFIANKSLRKEFYANTPLPAATWVQVQRLYTPALVLEVELVAEFPK